MRFQGRWNRADKADCLLGIVSQPFQIEKAQIA